MEAINDSEEDDNESSDVDEPNENNIDATDSTNAAVSGLDEEESTTTTSNSNITVTTSNIHLLSNYNRLFAYVFPITEVNQVMKGD